MAMQNNSKPKPGPAPVLVVKNQQDVGISLFVLMPAILASVLFNGALMAILYFIFQGMATMATAMEAVKDEDGQVHLVAMADHQGTQGTVAAARPLVDVLL